jgi:L-ascorbate metabolism protein UlaG (beta-lactamase superfamily)
MRKTRSTAIFAFLSGLFIFYASRAFAEAPQDTFSIHTLGHSAILFKYKGLIIYADPNSSYANYDTLPDADIILITHSHSDHYDTGAVNKIHKDSTILVCPKAVKNMKTYSGTIQLMNNGDSVTVRGIPVKAVPAYNITTSTLHVKGAGNGYVLTFNGKRIYFAGDTDLIPEMGSLGTIDIAFIPMNIEYSMTDSIVAEAARMIQPSILYLYHFGAVDTSHLRTLLVDKNIIVRMADSLWFESDKPQPRTCVQLDRAVQGIHSRLSGKNRFSSISCAHCGAVVSLIDAKGRVLQKCRLDNNDNRKIEVRSVSSGVCFVIFQGMGRAAKITNYKKSQKN